jgi:hypothetical protein
MRLKLFFLAAVVVGAVVTASVALAAGGLAGRYTTTIKSPAQLKGKWALTLAKNGVYTVSMNGEPLARGRYSATARSITFRESAKGCGGSGTYAWKRSGETVRFIRKREAASCQVRAAVLAHPFTRVR